MGLLGWAIVFLVVALIAGALGFRRTEAASVGIARVLFGIFLIVFLVLAVMALLGGAAVL